MEVDTSFELDSWSRIVWLWVMLMSPKIPACLHDIPHSEDICRKEEGTEYQMWDKQYLRTTFQIPKPQIRIENTFIHVPYHAATCGYLLTGGIARTYLLSEPWLPWRTNS